MHQRTHDRASDPTHAAHPADPIYLVKKIAWRSWIRFLSWRRRNAIRT
ncbi:hypothetical protein [Polaromonas aquatica]